jgi:hypothetical protein
MLALEPSDLELGDITRILFGANVSFVLRRRDLGFVLVGAAYCYGIMDGEVMEQDPAPESFMILWGGGLFLCSFQRDWCRSLPSSLWVGGKGVQETSVLKSPRKTMCGQDWVLVRIANTRPANGLQALCPKSIAVSLRN